MPRLFQVPFLRVDREIDGKQNMLLAKGALTCRASVIESHWTNHSVIAVFSIGSLDLWAVGGLGHLGLYPRLRRKAQCCD